MILFRCVFSLLIFSLLFSCSSRDSKVKDVVYVPKSGKDTLLKYNNIGKTGYIFFQIIRGRNDPLTEGIIGIRPKNEKGQLIDVATVYETKKEALLTLSLKGYLLLNRDSLAKAHKVNLSDTLYGFYVNKKDHSDGIRFRLPLAKDSLILYYYRFTEGK